MYKLVIDDLDTPERFESVEAAKAEATEIFGAELMFQDKNGILTAKFDGDIVVQIKQA